MAKGSEREMTSKVVGRRNERQGRYDVGVGAVSDAKEWGLPQWVHQDDDHQEHPVPEELKYKKVLSAASGWI
jgi:hypothetical protein